MAGVQEENRRRIALSLLAVGTALILLGVFLWISHQRGIADTATLTPMTKPGRSPVDKVTQVKVIQHVLFMLIVLIGILSVSLYALKVWSRRYRQALFRKPAAPTPSSDVWAMHKVPEELLPDDQDLNRPSPEGER